MWLFVFFFFLMIRRPPRSTRTDTLFPYTTLFRSTVSIGLWIWSFAMTNAGCARSMHLQTSPPQSTWRTIYCDPLRDKTQCGSGEKSQLGMTTSSPQLSHDDLFTRFPWQAGKDRKSVV